MKEGYGILQYTNGEKYEVRTHAFNAYNNHTYSVSTHITHCIVHKERMSDYTELMMFVCVCLSVYLCVRFFFLIGPMASELCQWHGHIDLRWRRQICWQLARRQEERHWWTLLHERGQIQVLSNTIRTLYPGVVSECSLHHRCVLALHRFLLFSLSPFLSFSVALSRSGMWEDDKASGPGTLEYSNGDVYTGEWENDQRHGTLAHIDVHTILHISSNFWLSY
jgi:hypothetical protein